MARRRSDGAWAPRPKASPEDLVVRKFVEELTETYGYPATHIVTSPQYRIKGSPSGRAVYPVDIAVFESARKKESELKIIVECKAPNVKSGKGQLRDYLSMSRAEVGVWFNGDGFAAIRKRVRGGKVEYVDIPDIPRLGERMEDIGMYRRKDLVAPHNLKRTFREIRNRLAGSSSSTTRDEPFAKGMINLILCKLYDEKYTRPGDMVRFRAGADEEPKSVARRTRELLSGARDEYNDVFDRADRIGLDDESIAHIVGRLQRYSLLDSERDAIADAFEVFIGPSLRGEKGQFFTPRNVVRAIVDILDIRHDDRVIDPACGSGGFLSECLRHIQRRVEQNGKKLGWPEKRTEAEKVKRVSSQLSGIEKDSFLSRVAKSYMIILGDGRSGIMCANALDAPEKWENGTGSTPALGSYDVVVTNPPFGSKITVSGEARLSQFDLGHKWRQSGGGGGEWIRGEPRKAQPPQILFIERCLEFLKEGGRMGIVLPDGILGNPNYGYVRQYVFRNAEVLGVVDMPADTFRPSTNTKTSVLFLRKRSAPRPGRLFVCHARTCGHDKRGSPIDSDDIARIPGRLRGLQAGSAKPSRLAALMGTAMIRNGILIPKYYNPEIGAELQGYTRAGHDLVTLGELADSGRISVENVRGMTKKDEPAEDSDQAGDVPFIRTSDIGNLEVMVDPPHCVDAAAYERVRGRQDLRDGDILMVRDGTFLIGKTAMVTDLDTRAVVQGHFYRIRAIGASGVPPHFLLGALNIGIVQKEIESKSFTQSSITTLGGRWREVRIPIPRDPREVARIDGLVKASIREKRDAKERLAGVEYGRRQECLMGLKNRAALGNS